MSREVWLTIKTRPFRFEEGLEKMDQERLKLAGRYSWKWAKHAKLYSDLIQALKKTTYQSFKTKYFLNHYKKKKKKIHSPTEPISDYGSTSWNRTGANIITPVGSLHTTALRVILLRYTTLMDSETVNTRPVFRINKGWLPTDGFWQRRDGSIIKERWLHNKEAMTYNKVTA